MSKQTAISMMIEKEQFRQALLRKKKGVPTCPNCGSYRLHCLVFSFISGNTYECYRCNNIWSNLIYGRVKI
jgi:hypothetical protein